ncbi:MAG: DoxX family protein [Bacteroidales bacterium]|nr:DoxX family protein [Bacteroidales bacterium]
MKNNQSFKYVFRVLLGILFLFSATAKLIGIDAFELYLFGFGWFPLGTAYLLARLVIAAEFTLGILLIANFWPRLAFWGSLALLGGFTVFLIALAVSGNRDNCNCFGELINLNPVQSIWKNVGMLAVLLLSAGVQPFRIRRKGLWFALAAVVPLATVLILSPPDNWRYDSYVGRDMLNEPALREALDQGILPHSVVEGDHVVCFFSLKCNFCRMSARKLMTLRERGDFPDAPIIALIGRGEDTDTTPFLTETGFRPDEVHFIEPADFLRITNGAMPLILVMHDENVVEKYNYRNLH